MMLRRTSPLPPLSTLFPLPSPSTLLPPPVLLHPIPPPVPLHPPSPYRLPPPSPNPSALPLPFRSSGWVPVPFLSSFHLISLSHRSPFSLSRQELVLSLGFLPWQTKRAKSKKCEPCVNVPGCGLSSGICSRRVPTHGECLLTGNVRSWEVSTHSGGCPLLRGASP